MTKLLAAREEQLSEIMGMASDAIVVTDEQTKVVFLNQAAEKMFGYTLDEVAGKSLYTFLVPERYKKLYLAWRQRALIEAEPAAGRKIRHFRRSIALHKDGSQVIGEMSATVAVIQGKPHLITITKDLSLRVKL